MTLFRFSTQGRKAIFRCIVNLSIVFLFFVIIVVINFISSFWNIDLSIMKPYKMQFCRNMHNSHSWIQLKFILDLKNVYVRFPFYGSMDFMLFACCKDQCICQFKILGENIFTESKSYPSKGSVSDTCSHVCCDCCCCSVRMCACMCTSS